MTLSVPRHSACSLRNRDTRQLKTLPTAAGVQRWALASRVRLACCSRGHSVPVRVVVDNQSGSLRPGLFVSADIEEATDKPPEPVLAVPDAAVQTIEGEPTVFVPVEGEEGTFEKKAVKVGEPVEGLVPVESGLKEGAKVVVEGAFVLKAELSKPKEEE